MKKSILAFAFLFLSAPAWAGFTKVSIIDSTTLDDSPTAVSGSADVRGAERMAFIVNYDETEVGNSVSAAVTVFVSFDNSNWLQASFYDYAGGSTLQTSETISADGRYYFWFNRDLVAPYVKVTITGTNTDADDTAVVSATMYTAQ